MIIQTNQIIPHTAPALSNTLLQDGKYLRDDLPAGSIDAEYAHYVRFVRHSSFCLGLKLYIRSPKSFRADD